jgi:hypothetical protein
MICVKRRRQYQRVARDLCEKEKTASVCNTRFVWNGEDCTHTSHVTRWCCLLRFTLIWCYSLMLSSPFHTNHVLHADDVFSVSPKSRVTRWCCLLRFTQIMCYTLTMSSLFHINLVLHVDVVFSVSPKCVTHDLCETEKTVSACSTRFVWKGEDSISV